MNKGILKYFDLVYFIRFAVLFLCLYALNTFLVGITTKGGLYNEFIDTYLNYPSWIRDSVLYASKFLASIFGIQSTIASPLITLYNGLQVEMTWPCVGLSIMSFWFAYIMAQHGPVKRRWKWSIAGLGAIWFVNCMRIFLLVISLDKGWRLNETIDNHDFFNYTSYLIVILMMWQFKKGANKFDEEEPKKDIAFSVV